MVQVITRYDHAGDTQLAHSKGICLCISLTDGSSFTQGTVCIKVVRQELAKMFHIIGDVLHQPVMHIERFFHICLAESVGSFRQLVQSCLYGSNFLRRAIVKFDCNRQVIAIPAR